jgi:hypothetical protein
MHGVWTAGEKKVNAEREDSRDDVCLLVACQRASLRLRILLRDD